mgnify:CR=1 FL=1
MYNKGKFAARNLSQEQLEDADVINNFQRLYSYFNAERAKVIEYALEVESLLTVVIIHSLVGDV